MGVLTLRSMGWLRANDCTATRAVMDKGTRNCLDNREVECFRWCPRILRQFTYKNRVIFVTPNFAWKIRVFSQTEDHSIPGLLAEDIPSTVHWLFLSPWIVPVAFLFLLCPEFQFFRNWIELEVFLLILQAENVPFAALSFPNHSLCANYSSM